jgi:hypothetical protein
MIGPLTPEGNGDNIPEFTNPADVRADLVKATDVLSGGSVPPRTEKLQPGSLGELTNALLMNQIEAVLQLPRPITVEQWQTLLKRKDFYKADRPGVISELIHRGDTGFINFLQQNWQTVISDVSPGYGSRFIMQMLNSSPTSLVWVKENWIKITNSGFKDSELGQIISEIKSLDPESTAWMHRLLLNEDRYNAPRASTLPLCEILLHESEESKQWVLQNLLKISDNGYFGFWSGMTALLIESKETNWIKQNLSEIHPIDYPLIGATLLFKGEMQYALDNWQLLFNKNTHPNDYETAVEFLIKSGKSEWVIQNWATINENLNQLHQLSPVLVGLINSGQSRWVIENWRSLHSELKHDPRYRDPVLETLRKSSEGQSRLNLKLFLGKRYPFPKPQSTTDSPDKNINE